MKTVAAALCAFSWFLSSSIAAAQTRAACARGDCEYHFDDEALDAPGYSAYGEWFKVRGRAKYVMLIRPRISFVPELLKSSDHL